MPNSKVLRLKTRKVEEMNETLLRILTHNAVKPGE